MTRDEWYQILSHIQEAIVVKGENEVNERIPTNEEIAVGKWDKRDIGIKRIEGTGGVEAYRTQKSSRLAFTDPFVPFILCVL